MPGSVSSGIGGHLCASKRPRFVTNHSDQLSLLPSEGMEMENEYWPKCSDAVRLGSKGRYGSFHLWTNVWVAGKTSVIRR